MEFGDVIIVIYPLRNNLFKIKIDKKLDVSTFYIVLSTSKYLSTSSELGYLGTTK